LNAPAHVSTGGTSLGLIGQHQWVTGGVRLGAGDVLNRIGYCTLYSLTDRYTIGTQERLLPVGLAKGAKLIRPVQKDSPITLDDVELQEPSTVLSLPRL